MTKLCELMKEGRIVSKRVISGSDYEDGRRVHSSEPSSACAPKIARHGFKVPQTHSKSFPNAAEIGLGAQNRH